MNLPPSQGRLHDYDNVRMKSFSAYYAVALRYKLEGRGFDSRLPIPVAERSTSRVCGRSVAGVAGSNPAGGMDVCVVCCTVRTKRQKPGQSGQRSTDKVHKKKGVIGIFQ